MGMIVGSVQCLPDVYIKIATQELVQDILAPMFQSAHQLASQNLAVIKPTSPQEVSVCKSSQGTLELMFWLREASGQLLPHTVVMALWSASSTSPKVLLKLAVAIWHLLHIQG